MHPLSRLAVAAAVACTLSGCAIVQSHRVADAERAGVGIPYMLPKALLTVQLVRSAGAIRVDLLEPMLVGDPSQLYVLNGTGTLFSSENLNIVVDPRTGLLKTVTLKSEDKTGEILQKLAGAKALKAESATLSSGDTLLFETVFDPGNADDVKDASQKLSAALKAQADRLQLDCAGGSAADDAKALCKLLAGQGTEVAITVDAPAVGTQKCDSTRPEAPVCGAGIFHRPTLPHRIQFSVFGVTRSTVALLPNNAPVLSLPLDRHAFVTTDHAVTLVDGTVSHLVSNVPSVGLAIAAAPVDVLKASLGAVSEVLTLKVDLSNKEAELANAKAEQIKAQAALDLEKAKSKEPPKAESASLGAKPTHEGVLLSASIGAARPASMVPGGKSGFDTSKASAAAASASAASKGSDGSLGK